MRFMEGGAWQGLEPAVHPKHLRSTEALLFHREAVLLALSATCHLKPEGVA